ncbi:MAG: ribosome small subunit-dependent GTPase A [Peptococcaceae bacterium]|nr:ribosome small subunit-dependent GTPase A [Peptococcaceae bacterium]
MVNGIITKAYGGFYFVRAGRDSWQCTLKGVFRHRGVGVMVGDRVDIRPGQGLQGVVEKVYPRRNLLARPPVANVDRAVIVFAARDPEPSLILLDRFLVLAGAAGIQPVICLNKVDLAAGESPDFLCCYAAAGYRVLRTSARDGTGVNTLREILREGISVFAGPSGVGKSSLLNAVQPGLSLKTGEVGPKIKRGRHTTRHVELIALEGGGMVADTPGFSSLFLPDIKKEELFYYYPEMERYAAQCRFRSCLHSSEPGCAVKEAVARSGIDGGRYRRYLELLGEIIERERSY